MWTLGAMLAKSAELASAGSSFSPGLGWFVLAGVLLLAVYMKRQAGLVALLVVRPFWRAVCAVCAVCAVDGRWLMAT